MAAPRSLLESVQSSSRVLMVRPAAFARDDEAAESNAYMKRSGRTPEEVARLARDEFDGAADALRGAGVEVVVIDDDPGLPDSVFPNNWFSYHQPIDGCPIVVTYPMAAAARRPERREAILDRVRAEIGGAVDRIRLEQLETEGEALEGTGSLVLDRVRGVAFACRSARTTDRAVQAWTDVTGYRVVLFDATDDAGRPIYHTNVIMSLADHLGVWCSEAIRDRGQRRSVLTELEQSVDELVDISTTEVGCFGANIIGLRSGNGEHLFAMSAAARNGLSSAHLGQIESVARLVTAPIPTIETVGGGSLRCMVAELGSGKAL